MHTAALHAVLDPPHGAASHSHMLLCKASGALHAVQWSAVAVVYYAIAYSWEGGV